MTEIPTFRYLFKKKPDVGPGLEKLSSDLKRILTSEPTITVVDDDVADRWFDA
jgi:hypothetical protein